MSYQLLTQHSSHLWISDQQTVEQQLIADLQQTLCAHNGCTKCTICLQIEQKTHPWIQWLEPNNSYTLDQVNETIQSVQFILDHTEKRFFIFTQAEELSSACCNRLLKTIEEPHSGYHFVFLTNRPEAILATLRSRCIQRSFSSSALLHSYQEILQPFISLQLNNPVKFMKSIEKNSIKEAATKEIIDLLLEHFHNTCKQIIKESTGQTIIDSYLDILVLVKQQLQQLPLSGSSKLFWKNFYLQFHQITICLQK